MGYSISWSKNSKGSEPREISLFNFSTLGICFSLVVCGVIDKFGAFLSSHKMAASLILLISVTLGTCFKTIKTGGLQTLLATIIKKVPALAIVSIIFVTIYSGGFTNTPDLKIRNGPDIIGWLSSAQYFEKHETIQELESWMSKEFPNHPKINAFAKSSWGTKDSIYATASYTKQLQSEFLIGADRRAIPIFLAILSRYLPENFNLFKIYLAFSCLLAFLLALWAFENFPTPRVNKSRALKLYIIPLTLFFSYQILFPVFEGGFGQHFSYIMFVYLLNQSDKKLSGELLVVLGAAFFAYKDLILFALPFLAALNFVSARQSSRTGIQIIWKLKFHLFLSICTLILAIAIAPFILERARSLSFGGWEEGYMPSILDILGLSGAYTWSIRGTTNDYFALFSLALTYIFSLYFFRKLTKLRTLLAGIILLAFYTFLWIVSLLNSNNYSLWKTLPYFTIFIVFLLSKNASLVSKTLDSKIGAKKNRFNSKILNFVIMLQVFCACFFYQQWAKDSERLMIFTIDTKKALKIGSLVDQYAISFKGVEFTQSYALLGNMEWADEARQVPNQPSKQSIRPVMFSIPVEICNSASDKDKILYLDDNYCFVIVKNS